MQIDDSEDFQIIVFGPSHDSFNEYDFCWMGDSLRLDYFEKIGENEYNIKTLREPCAGYNEPRDMAFYMRNVKNKQVTFHILECSADLYWSTPTYGNLYAPVYTIDGIQYERITTRSYSNGVYTFSLTPSHDIIRISRWFTKAFADIESSFYAYTNPFIQVSTIGQSHQGRNMMMVEMTNFEVPESQKTRMFLIGQQHPGEPYSPWLIEGIIDYYLENPQLLDYIHFYFIPIMNPDGVYHVIGRCNANGVDLNRAWDKNTGSSGYAIEVDVVRTKIQQIHQQNPIEVFIDIHGFCGGKETHELYPTKTHEWTTNFRNKNVFDVPISVSSGSGCGSSAMARGWACYRGIPYCYTYEPVQRDFRVTLDHVIGQGRIIGQTLYESFL